MSISCEVRGGTDGRQLFATVSGLLRPADTDMLRKQLLTCLTEHPTALLVDLSGLRTEQPAVLSVFTELQGQADLWPGTPVLLCGPPPAVREVLLGSVDRPLPLFDDLPAALAHVHGERPVTPSISEDLLPLAGSTRHGRDIATEACLRWELPDLIAPASLIVNELVANVVDHAHTMMTLRLSLRPRRLDIAVRDGSAVAPDFEPQTPAEERRGRGLLLINEMAQDWGWLPSRHGKVVWAALRRP